MGTAALDEVIGDARPRLLSVAYRMLGSMSDAEDVVQDAIVKARRGAPDDLESPVAYLTAVTTRTAIDHLRSARVRRETYVGPWLPEPVPADPAPDVADRAVLADSLSMAFLVVLESLGPEERAALLLHDVFGYSHAEVAAVLDRSEAASRQLLRRARRRIEADRPRFAVDRVGSDRIARFLAKTLRRGDGELGRVVVEANGGPALALLVDDRLVSIVTVEPAADGSIGVVRLVRNPAKLARMRPVVLAARRA